MNTNQLKINTKWTYEFKFVKHAIIPEYDEMCLNI